jgi:hypothetical protein
MGRQSCCDAIKRGAGQLEAGSLIERDTNEAKHRAWARPDDISTNTKTSGRHRPMSVCVTSLMPVPVHLMEVRAMQLDK